MLFSYWKRFVLALILIATAVALSARASATVIYSVCSSGCTTSSGGYSAIQTNATSGVTLSSDITFTAANLSGGVYTDPATGVSFAPQGSGVTLGVSGTALTYSPTGSGTGYQITLPANTYSFGMNLSLPGGGYALVNGIYFVLSSGFFGLDSDVPITSLVVAESGGSGVNITDFEAGSTGGSSGGATPELSTFLLIGTGLIGIGCGKRRALKASRVAARTA